MADKKDPLFVQFEALKKGDNTYLLIPKREFKALAEDSENIILVHEEAPF